LQIDTGEDLHRGATGVASEEGRPKMGIALVIVGGVVLVTILGLGFDFAVKRRNKLDSKTKQRVTELERKVANLELMVKDKDDRVARLEGELSFVNKLLEKK
jgi:hypothetical protein